MATEFIDVTDQYNRGEGGERWIRTIDDHCYISVLHRRTGFGYMEWESAIVFIHENATKFADRDVLIIRGDWRDELMQVEKDDLRAWYYTRIPENRISFDQIISAIKEG